MMFKFPSFKHAPTAPGLSPLTQGARALTPETLVARLGLPNLVIGSLEPRPYGADFTGTLVAAASAPEVSVRGTYLDGVKMPDGEPKPMLVLRASSIDGPEAIAKVLELLAPDVTLGTDRPVQLVKRPGFNARPIHVPQIGEEVLAYFREPASAETAKPNWRQAAAAASPSSFEAAPVMPAPRVDAIIARLAETTSLPKPILEELTRDFRPLARGGSGRSDRVLALLEGNVNPGVSLLELLAQSNLHRDTRFEVAKAITKMRGELAAELGERLAQTGTCQRE